MDTEFWFGMSSETMEPHTESKKLKVYCLSLVAWLIAFSPEGMAIDLG